MEMTCPYCKTRSGLTATHRHLLDEHLDKVVMQRDEEMGKMQYRLQCPFCDLDYLREVNPRGRNQRFLEEFRMEIGLVAFDQLLYHLLQEHPSQVGVDPAVLGRDTEEGT